MEVLKAANVITCLIGFKIGISVWRKIEQTGYEVIALAVHVSALLSLKFGWYLYPTYLYGLMYVALFLVSAMCASSADISVEKERARARGERYNIRKEIARVDGYMFAFLTVIVQVAISACSIFH